LNLQKIFHLVGVAQYFECSLVSIAVL